MTESTRDLTDLRDAGAAIEELASAAVIDAISTMVTVMSHNNAWGTDQVGGAFAHVYLEPAEEAMGAVMQTGYQLGEVAEKLAGTTSAYRETEESNTGEAGTVQV
ncbi:hypothetical protein ACQBAU_01620 [Propionibacteriaceae bacterium Y2011]